MPFSIFIRHITACVFCVTFLALSSLTTATTARASADLSAPEDIAIAFFKLGDSTPDFETWAKHSKQYKSAAPVLALDILEKERQRLIGKWRAFDPEEDILSIRGPVAVQLKTTMDNQGVEQYWMHIIYDAGDVAYFPFKYLQYDFAVIPQQLDSFLTQPLQKQQFEFIKKDLLDTRGKAYLYLQLKPVKAYMNQPYVIDGEQQWALISDIATMALVSKETKKPIWNYGSDWYVSPVTEDLRDLYRAPEEVPATDGAASIPVN